MHKAELVQTPDEAALSPERRLLAAPGHGGDSAHAHGTPRREGGQHGTHQAGKRRGRVQQAPWLRGGDGKQPGLTRGHSEALIGSSSRGRRPRVGHGGRRRSASTEPVPVVPAQAQPIVTWGGGGLGIPEALRGELGPVGPASKIPKPSGLAPAHAATPFSPQARLLQRGMDVSGTQPPADAAAVQAPVSPVKPLGRLRGRANEVRSETPDALGPASASKLRAVRGYVPVEVRGLGCRTDCPRSLAIRCVTTGPTPRSMPTSANEAEAKTDRTRNSYAKQPLGCCKQRGRRSSSSGKETA